MSPTPAVTLPDMAFIPMIPAGDFATLAFYLAIGFYAVFTGVLYYHWNAYTSDVKVAFATYIAYAAITIPLLLIMAGSLFAI
jgi:hypothetical protein